MFGDEEFVVSASCLHLFLLIIEYCSCAQFISDSSSIDEVQHYLIELLNLFNSKTCQLVLGAGAVKLTKIKTISAKILALTCRSLQFIQIILPKIKQRFDQLTVPHFLFNTENNENLTNLLCRHRKSFSFGSPTHHKEKPFRHSSADKNEAQKIWNIRNE